jgi:hypothetical protein
LADTTRSFLPIHASRRLAYFFGAPVDNPVLVGARI